MKMAGRTDRMSAIERPTCSSVVLNSQNNGTECQTQNHPDVMLHSHHHRHVSSSAVRNIEIDWREVDPYFSELSDCASFWTLINFVSKNNVYRNMLFMLVSIDMVKFTHVPHVFRHAM